MKTVDFSIGKVVTGSAASGELTVSDGFQVTSDQYVVWADVDNHLIGSGYQHKLFSLGFGLMDSTGLALNSSDLLLVAPDMKDFNSSHFDLIFGQGDLDGSYLDSLRVSGIVNSIERVDPVPEPATIFLFGAGLLGLFGVGMRKRS
jgi:hypothetical protein